MKNRLWLTQIPVVVLFTFCYWVSELGVHGKLENAVLREKFYPLLNRVSSLLTDLKFNLRGSVKPKNKIVVVEIDGNALESYGRWPWHRDLTALLVQKIFDAGAKVVGLDIAFSEPDPRVPPELVKYLSQRQISLDLDQFESDQILADVIRAHSDRIVLGWASEAVCQPLYSQEEKDCPVTHPAALALFPGEFEKFSLDSFISPSPFDPKRTPMISFVTPLANLPEYNRVAKHAGYFNSTLDPDGSIRRTNLVAIAKGKPFVSLPLEMARVGMGENLRLTLNQKQRVESLQFIPSGRSISVTPLGVMQINFRGPSSEFVHVSAADILSEATASTPLPSSSLPASLSPTNLPLGAFEKAFNKVFEDAYVLIGLSALGVFDMRQFPFESNSPGVYGHANVLDNLLSGDPLVVGAWGFGASLLYFMMVIGVAAFAIAIEHWDAIPALLLFLGTFVTLGVADFKILFTRNYNLNTVFLYLEVGTVFIFILAAKYVAEERNKKFIRNAFVKYVAPEVVDSILKDPAKLSLGGEKRELTILFSDVRGFTTFSEKMDAKVLSSFLNEYLGIMTELIFANHGTLDKYIGDAIMAFWGAPLAQKPHAANGCAAALQMLLSLEKHRERFKARYGMDVKIGIGINSGVVSVGNMGSERNFEYTVIGDHVNLASRMEGLTKVYQVPILTSRFTFDCIERSGQPLPNHRVLDLVKVKGKRQSVELLQVLDKDGPSDALEKFAEGRVLYRAQAWQEAIEAFQAASKIFLKATGQADGPSELFIERCRAFSLQPPPIHWDGSWEMDSK